MAEASKAVRKRTKRKLSLSKAQAEREAEEENRTFRDRRIAADKKEYLRILKENMGLYARSAAKMGLCRKTPEVWRAKDPEFNEACIAIQREKVELVEGHLIANITNGNVQAQKFFLKCKGNYTRTGDVPEGWVERFEIGGTEGQPIAIDANIKMVREEMSDGALALAMVKAMKAVPQLFPNNPYNPPAGEEGSGG